MTTATEDRTEFLAERRTGVGGSDAAAIVGVNPWRTPLDVFREKLGLEPPKEESPGMLWGNLLEDPIAEHYARTTGYRVRRQRAAKRHKRYSWMLAHLDRSIDPVPGEPRRILEVKTAGRWAKLDDWGAAGTDEIPPYYLTQVHHYLAVTDAEVCDVAVLIAGQDFRIYTVERHPGVERNLVERERVFWEEHVEKMIAPRAEARDRFRFSNAGVLEVDDNPDARSYVEALLEVRAKRKALEKAEEAHVGRLQELLGDDFDALKLDGRIVARWKTQFAQRFDSKAFRAKFPDVYQQFVRPKDSRPFRFEDKAAAQVLNHQPSKA